MSEPLTKGTFKKSSQKPLTRLTRNDIHIISDDMEDFQIQVVTLEKLKSALEWLKERMVTNCFDKELVDLAFPAIYEKEKGDDKNGK